MRTYANAFMRTHVHVASCGSAGAAGRGEWAGGEGKDRCLSDASCAGSVGGWEQALVLPPDASARAAAARASIAKRNCRGSITDIDAAGAGSAAHSAWRQCGRRLQRAWPGGRM